MANRSVALDVIIRTVTEGKGLDEATGKFGKFQSGMQKAALPAAAVITAIGGVATAAVSAASDVEQSMGALDSVFGKNADTVKQWAQTAAQDVGIGKAAWQLAAGLGAQLKNLGLGSDQALSGTHDLIGLGADLSAAFGGTAADAVEALGSALRGEADPAEKYGLSLNQAKVNAKLAEKGLTGLTGTALTAAKAQAIMELATEQAGGAVGQFARESDTAAGAAQRNSAAWTDAMAALGTALLPAVTALSEKFSALAGFVKDNSTAFTIIAAIVGGVAAAVLIINGALAVYNAVAAVATVVQWAMNAAWLAFPLVWIVVAIVAVIAIIVLLWNKNEAFRNAVIAIWDAIKSAFNTSIEFIKNLLTNLGDFFGKIPGWVSSALSTVSEAIKTPFRIAIDWVKGAVEWFSSGFNAITGWISSALSGIYNAITSPFRTAIEWVKGAIDGIKGAWNSVARGINSVSVTFGPIPDWVPGIGGQSWDFNPPNVPELARGGWITRPTLALVGEGRSSEIVAPEPMLRKILRQETGSRNYSINVTVAAGVTPAEVGRQIVDSIRAFERAAGPGWRAA